MFQALIINYVIPVVAQMVLPSHFLVTPAIYLQASEWKKIFLRQIMKGQRSSPVWPLSGLDRVSFFIDCRIP
jgi:hypothetical protein